MPKDSLIRGTLILTVAALVARVLGAVQRIPLVELLGNTGMGSYTIAFNIYSILLVVATAGIPSALSKLVSERTALGRYAEAERIYRAAVQFSLAAGAVMAVLLFAAAPYYAGLAHDPESVPAIRAIAPALLLFPLIAIMRGYFQGRQHMMPNGLSQVIEQILRLATAVGLAYVLLRVGYGQPAAVAGASFGAVTGSVGAIAVMLYFAWKLRREDRAEAGAGTPGAQAFAGTETPLAKGRIYRMIFAYSVPIVIFSMTVPLIYFIDSTITIPLLEGDFGTEGARAQLGILGGRAQSLAGIPIILAIALSQSIVPVISSAYARKETQLVQKQASRALQLSIVSGLPMVLAICAAARSVNIFLFGDAEGTAIIAALTLSAMFQIVMQTSGAILMGLGEMRKLVYFVLAGCAVKLAASFLLSPLLGIYGIITATALCFLVMTACNLRLLRSKVAFTILGRRWAGLLLTAAVSWAAGAGAEALLHAYAPWLGIRVSAGFHAFLAGIVTLVLYGILLAAARVVTPEDIRGLPGPLAKLLGRPAPSREASREP